MPRGASNTFARPNHSRTKACFTRIAQFNDDETNLVAARDRTCYAVLHRYPYVGGGLMIVPYQPTADLNGLVHEELVGLWELTRRCVNGLAKLAKPDVFNIGTRNFLGKHQNPPRDVAPGAIT